MLNITKKILPLLLLGSLLTTHYETKAIDPVTIVVGTLFFGGAAITSINQFNVSPETKKALAGTALTVLATGATCLLMDQLTEQPAHGVTDRYRNVRAIGEAQRNAEAAAINRVGVTPPTRQDLQDFLDT